MAKWRLSGPQSGTLTDGVLRYYSFNGSYPHSGSSNPKVRFGHGYTFENLRNYGFSVSGPTPSVSVNHSGSGSLSTNVTASTATEDTSGSISTTAHTTELAFAYDQSSGMHGDSFNVTGVSVGLDDGGSNIPPFVNGTPSGSWGLSGSVEYASVIGDVTDQASGTTAADWTLRAAQTISDLDVHGLTGSSGSFTLYKNGSATSMTVSWIGAGYMSDTSNTVSYAAGDTIEAGAVAAGGSSGPFSFIGDATQGAIWWANASSSTAAYYLSFRNDGGSVSTEISTQWKQFDDSATLKNFHVYAKAYSETRAVTVRVNGSATSITVSPSSTGLFEDTSNTASISAGDLISVGVASGSGTTNAYMAILGLETAVATFTPAVAAFRFYEDGTESGSSPIDSQDTNISRNVDSNSQVHLRYRIDETGGLDGATTDDFGLEYSRNSGAWTAVTASSSYVQSDTASSLTADGATTNRATNGISDPATGSFVAGEQEETNGVIEDRQLTADNFTEHVWALLLISADLSNGDTLDFRVTLNGGAPGMTNSVTPRITATKTTATKPSRLTLLGVS